MFSDAYKIFDIAVTGGKIADVESGRFYEGNIGILNGSIEYIGDATIFAKKNIDASGRVVSPGFIDFHSHIDGNTYSGECLVRQGGTTTLGGERMINSKRVRSLADGFIVNQGYSVSQSFVLRQAVGIHDSKRPATRGEISIMTNLARHFLSNGAYSINFALELVPGTSFDELLAIANAAKEFDRPITVHMRKDGMEALDCFREIIDVGKLTGVKIQILQLMYMVGIGGAMPKAIEIIEDALDRGLDITCDSGVYDAYCASVGTGIFDKGFEKGYGNFSVNDLIVSSGIYCGSNCTAELFDELRKDYPQTLVTAFVCDPEAVEMALKKDYIYVSTNAADGPHYPGIGAPEVAGTYPRLLGKYVRENRTLPLIEALRKITILPARRFGINNVGEIKQGKNADIVIFDPDTIDDRADFIGRGRPDLPPVGIDYVIVNGEIVVDHGELTENTKAGRLIKKL